MGKILGIDIGGTGIKGALVNVETGDLLSDRIKISTPFPATPESISKVVKNLTQHFKYNGVIGCGFPAIIKDGKALSAANIDQSWIGVDVEKLLTDATNMPVFVANDADMAGIAEQKFGFATSRHGIVILLTFGTGIGSALIHDGVLVPNTEFGHLKFKGTIAEKYTSNQTREDENLDWTEYGKRINEFLQYLEFIFSPNLFILGGGISKKFDKFQSFLKLETKTVPAQFQNDAGIIGAAYYAFKHP